MVLERVAHVPDLGHHNLVSAKALAKTLDVPMRLHPAATVCQPRHGGKPLIVKILHRKNGMSEMKAPRCVATHWERKNPCPSRSLVAVRRNTRNIMEFRHLLGHSSEEIRCGTVRAPGVQLTET